MGAIQGDKGDITVIEAVHSVQLDEFIALSRTYSSAIDVRVLELTGLAIIHTVSSV